MRKLSCEEDESRIVVTRGWERGERIGKGWLVGSSMQEENGLMFYNYSSENIIYNNLLYISK